MSSEDSDAKLEGEDKLSLLYRQTQDTLKAQNQLIAKIREDHRKEVEEIKRSAASVSFPGKPQLEGLVDKIVTTKLQAFAKKVAAAINNKFAAAIQKSKTNADSVSELENTLNMWPRQLQVAVYEPLNDLTSKVGNLQKMLDESRNEVNTMRLRCEELERRLEMVKSDDSNGSKLTDSVSELKRRVETLHSTRNMEALEKRMKSHVEKTMLKKESNSELKHVIEELERRMKLDIDELRRGIDMSKENDHAMEDLEKRLKLDVSELRKQINDTKLKDTLEKVLDERCEELKTQILKRNEKTKSEVETLISESIRKSQDEMTEKMISQAKNEKKDDIAPRILFESPTKEKETNSSVIRTPDVERTLGKILGDESSSSTPQMGTPDVERFVGQILDDGTQAVHTTSLRELRDEIEESNRDIMEEMRTSLSRHCENVALKISTEESERAQAAQEERLREHLCEIEVSNRKNTDTIASRCENTALRISTRELERAQAAQEERLREHLCEIEVSNRKNTKAMTSRCENVALRISTEELERRDEYLREKLGEMEVSNRKNTEAMTSRCEHVATKMLETHQKRLNLSISNIKKEFETSRKKDRSSLREQEMISKRTHEDVTRQKRLMSEVFDSTRQQISSLKRSQDQNAMKIRDAIESNRVGSEKEQTERDETLRLFKTRFTEKVQSLEKMILSVDTKKLRAVEEYREEFERSQATQLEHLRNMRQESEEHASALDRRCTDWSRRAAKSMQTHQKRQNVSMTNMSEEFEAFRESQREQLESSREESLRNLEELMSRRIQTDMTRQERLLNESMSTTREQILDLRRQQEEIRDALEFSQESFMKKEQDGSNVEQEKQREEMNSLFTENMESLEERLRRMQSSESRHFEETTSRIRDVLLKNQMNLSDRLETRTETLSQSLDQRLEMLESRTSSWCENMALAQESRVCSEVSKFEDSLQSIQSDLETLNLRVDSGHQQARQEAATLRARHVDVVDALVRTKRCQAEMSRTTSCCHAIEESLKRIRSRLSAAEKRLPEMQEQIASTADGFHQNIARLSEDIGTVSCSVADLKMSVAGPSLAPLVVNDSQLLL